jgi:alcohol dehydrogenase class IV
MIQAGISCIILFQAREAMKFEFATATRIIFGPGTIQQVTPLAIEMGKRACVVTGRTAERAQPILEQLNAHKIEYVTFSVTGEPTIDTVKNGIELARNAEIDFVISIGGGSVIDTGKAVAAMLTNSGQLEEYLEVVGAGKPLSRIAAAHIAIPTTAGTGAEVTRNSVLAVPKQKVKVSMRSHLMLPRLAVVDPELTYSMPQAVTANTGMDALTQLIEAYTSRNSNPLTDGICREGLKRAGSSLKRAYENGNDKIAREDMAVASFFGGLGLANAKLGAVHGLAGPLGGMISTGHGAICAGLLPYVLEANVRALQNRRPDSEALARYDDVAQILTGRATVKAIDGIKWVFEIYKTLQIQPLSRLGLEEQDFPTAAAKAQKSSSMKGNPIDLTKEELTEILKKAT